MFPAIRGRPSSCGMVVSNRGLYRYAGGFEELGHHVVVEKLAAVVEVEGEEFVAWTVLNLALHGCGVHGWIGERRVRVEPAEELAVDGDGRGYGLGRARVGARKHASFAHNAPAGGHDFAMALTDVLPAVERLVFGERGGALRTDEVEAVGGKGEVGAVDLLQDNPRGAFGARIVGEGVGTGGIGMLDGDVGAVGDHCSSARVNKRPLLAKDEDTKIGIIASNPFSTKFPFSKRPDFGIGLEQ
ncbi:hypothetical protein BC938DRAFT_470765 [Jimgerdemannia flammicorona]|uniref:Uncharacterized protein n=1 Tax=Jimgerdemannia flammicorona TaxID=994334 RepID=A0A433Q9J5_9FUNG|nr:hypothetical protein BC938DRAFT_470765 [Jimgerdemannia flammicorona]